MGSSATNQSSSAPSSTAGDAFKEGSIAVMAYADGITIWHYRAATTDFLKAGFFNECRHLFREGDEIIVTHWTVTGTNRACGHVHHFDSDLNVHVEWQYVSPAVNSQDGTGA